MPDIKWGIIDYYGEKKLAFDYVKRAYQPLLVSLEYTKRRWNAGKNFDGELWIVNDLHEAFKNVTLSWSVTNSSGEVRQKESTQIDIAGDSSTDVQSITWLVEGEKDEAFRVDMKLTASDGTVLSRNFHTLLVGDQEEAKEYCRKMHEKVSASARSYGKSYYRYFPEMWDFE